MIASVVYMLFIGYPTLVYVATFPIITDEADAKVRCEAAAKYVSKDGLCIRVVGGRRD